MFQCLAYLLLPSLLFLFVYLVLLCLSFSLDNLSVSSGFNVCPAVYMLIIDLLLMTLFASEVTIILDFMIVPVRLSKCQMQIKWSLYQKHWVCVWKTP